MGSLSNQLQVSDSWESPLSKEDHFLSVCQIYTTKTDLSCLGLRLTSSLTKTDHDMEALQSVTSKTNCQNSSKHLKNLWPYIWPAKRQKESECRGGIGGEIKHSVVALKKNNHHTLFLPLLRLTKGLLPLSISRLCYCSANLASFVQKSDIHRHSQSLEWWPFSNLQYAIDSEWKNISQRKAFLVCVTVTDCPQ